MLYFKASANTKFVKLFMDAPPPPRDKLDELFLPQGTKLGAFFDDLSYMHFIAFPLQMYLLKHIYMYIFGSNMNHLCQCS